MLIVEVGTRIERVEILGPAIKGVQGRLFHPARCDCGKEWNARRDSLQAGLILSCGCLGLERRTKANVRHGMRPRGKSPPEYNSWADMRQRCGNKNSVAYAWYGARGIKVCERWDKSFAAFYEDMGPRPSGLTLERIDNQGNYEPGNCKWATRTEQMQNTRYVRIVEVDGVKMAASAAAALIGVKRNQIYGRVRDHRCSYQQAVDHFRAILGT